MRLPYNDVHLHRSWQSESTKVEMELILPSLYSWEDGRFATTRPLLLWWPLRLMSQGWRFCQNLYLGKIIGRRTDSLFRFCAQMESHAESLKQLHVIASYKRYKPKEAPGILERPQIQAWAQNKHLCFFQFNQSCLYPSNSLAPIAGPSRFESSHNAVLLLSSFFACERDGTHATSKETNNTFYEHWSNLQWRTYSIC